MGKSIIALRIQVRAYSQNLKSDRQTSRTISKPQGRSPNLKSDRQTSKAYSNGILNLTTMPYAKIESSLGIEKLSYSTFFILLFVTG